LNHLKLFPKQLEFIQRPERIGLLLAGLGFGKSYTLAVYIVTKALIHPGSQSAMASRDHKQLILALDKEVRLVLSQMGLIEGKHFSRTISPHLTYKFRNQSTIIGLSAENYDSAFRGVNLNFLVLDELGYYDELAFRTALGRVRLNPSQIRTGTTPKGFNFVHENFIEKPNKSSFVIKATTYDNPLLSSDYVESLRESYPQRLFDQECMAEFVDMSAEAAYYAFNKEFNVAKVEQEPDAQIYCGLDFNVSPMCSVIFQVIGNKIKVFNEIIIPDNADTYKFGFLLKEHYGTNVNIISDSTGSNRSTVGPSNHAALRSLGFNLLPSKNPFVFDRVMMVNKMLQDKRILIDHKCGHLIRCLSKTTWNKSGKLDQTKDKTLTHSSDSLGYAVFKLFPPVPGKYSSVDRSSSVLIESNQNY